MKIKAIVTGVVLPAIVLPTFLLAQQPDNSPKLEKEKQVNAPAVAIVKKGHEKGDLTKIPKMHPVHGMKPGQIKVVGGVTIVGPGKWNPKRPISAGVSLDKQPPILPQSKELTKEERKALVKWTSDRRSKGLSSEARKKVFKAYHELSDSSDEISTAVEKKKLTLNQGRKKLAKAVVKSMLIERKAFGKEKNRVPKNNIFRAFDPGSVGPREIDAAEQTLESFLRGDYLTGKSSKTNKTSSFFGLIPKAHAYTATSRLALSRPTYPISTSTIKLEPKTCTSWGTEATTHWEFRVYIAEHDVPGFMQTAINLPIHDYNSSEDTNNIQHVSVVGGVVRHSKQVGNPLYSWCRGRVLVHEYPVEWLIANGAGSTYESGDRITLKFAKVFSTRDEAVKFALSHTPTSQGKYTQMRAAAYSRGWYGTDWVCHNLANAFTLRRWGIRVTSSDTHIGTLVFGPYGRRGISQRTDWTGSIHRGCVPLNNCFWTVAYPVPGVSSAFDRVADAAGGGTGYGLSIKWMPNRNGWYSTRTSYESVPISIKTSKISRIL